MPHYVNNSCLAFTWSSLGQCRGVRLRRSGDRCRVEAFWGDDTGRAVSLAETLAAGRRTLGGSEMTVCLAGATDSGWGMADVDMPNLKAAELRNALSFELRKHTPLPVERLTWGYRVLAKKNNENRVLVRLYYLKSDIWRQWVEAASGLGQLDVLLPPPVALDPLLNGKTVFFPGRNTHDCFRFVPSGSGRAIVAAAGPESERPQTLAEALPLEQMDFGGLKELPIEEQLSYVGALTLGVYGLTRSLSRDLSTLAPTPEGLRPRRNQGVRVLAYALGLYILGCLLIGGVRAGQSRLARLRLLESERQAIQTQTAILQKQLNPEVRAYAKTLKQELTDAIAITPSLPQALLELTRLIEPPTWMSGRFEWKEGGQVDFQIQEVESDPELATRLEYSPILGDVRELSSVYDARENKRTRKFTLNVRYDTDKERAEAQAAAEKRREQEAAAAAKAAADEMAEDGEGEEETAVAPATGGDEAEHDDGSQEQPPAPPRR
ncbi:MAG: hypothetical protein ACOX6W_15490 [Lentisphaeria bacterium]|jgi:hypothetical protein